MKYCVDSYIIMNKKIGLIVYTYIMIIIVITLSLIIFLTMFHYKTYYKIRGVVEEIENKYYIRIYVPLDATTYIVDNNKVRINKKNYSYTIGTIEEEYLIDNFNNYQIILIELKLPSNYQINNLSLELQFLKEDKRAINYIIRR